MTTVIALELVWSYCSRLPMIMNDVNSNTLGWLPAMKSIEPYAPTAGAKAVANPVSQASNIAGKMTRLNETRGDCRVKRLQAANPTFRLAPPQPMVDRSRHAQQPESRAKPIPVANHHDPTQR